MGDSGMARPKRSAWLRFLPRPERKDQISARLLGQVDVSETEWAAPPKGLGSPDGIRFANGSLCAEATLQRVLTARIADGHCDHRRFGDFASRHGFTQQGKIVASRLREQPSSNWRRVHRIYARS